MAPSGNMPTTSLRRQGSNRGRKLAPAGTPTLESFFSPTQRSSGSGKRKVVSLLDSENTVNGVSAKRRSTGRGTSTTPLVLVDTSESEKGDSPDSHILSVEDASTMTSRALQPIVNSVAANPRGKTTLGLVRVPNARQAPKTLFCQGKDARGLFVGAILGRNVGSSNGRKHRSKANRKIDLGVQAIGVSREHLEIISVTESTVTMKQFQSARNKLFIYRYCANKKKMSTHPEILTRGSSICLAVGDTVELDPYNNTVSETGQRTFPKHVFRVVKMPMDELNIPAKAYKTPNKRESIENAGDKSADRTPAFSPPIDLVANIEASSKNPGSDFVPSVSEKSEKPDFEERPSTGKPSEIDCGVTFRVETNDAGQCPSNTSEDRDCKNKPMASIVTAVAPDTRQASANEKVEMAVTQTASAEVKLVDMAEVQKQSSGALMNETTIGVVDVRAELDNADRGLSPSATCGTDNEIETAYGDNEQQCDRAGEVAVAEMPGGSLSDVVATDRELHDEKATQHSIETPVVGERFRVLFEEYTDVFGYKSSAWFFGTATTVAKIDKRKSADPQLYNLHILYDDNATSEVTFPADDVQRVEVDPDTGFFQAEFIHKVTSNKLKTFAYDPNPRELACGDLVDCRYQNGSSSGAWYRGRVAAVNTDSRTCDVAYDDGEFECGVPIQNGNIILVKRGCDDCSWLQRQTVHEAFQSPHAASGQRRRGKVVKIGKTDSGSAHLKVHFSDGRCQAWTYSEVVTALFAFHREKCSKEGKIKFWPSPPQDNSLAEPAEGNHVDINEQLNMSQDSCASFPIGHDNKSGSTAQEMHPMLANSLWRALDSQEPHLGAELLTLMTKCHKYSPPSALGKNLKGIMIRGPKSESMVFSDPNRMEVAANFVFSLTAQPASLPASMCISTWDDAVVCMQQATNELYQAPGDLSRTTSTSLQRVGSSLQVASYAAQYLAYQLETQLKDFVKDNSAMKSKSYKSEPVVRALLDCPDGIRGALKCAVRLNVRAWIQRGHFVLSNSVVKEKAEDSAGVQFCSEGCKLCLKYLGKITCYMSWLYCAEGGMSIGAKSCSYLIKDALLAEIEGNDFDFSQFISLNRKISSAMKDAYWKQLKLRFLLSIDGEFAGPLRSTLGGLLNLSNELRIVTC